MTIIPLLASPTALSDSFTKSISSAVAYIGISTVMGAALSKN